MDVARFGAAVPTPLTSTTTMLPLDHVNKTVHSFRLNNPNSSALRTSPSSRSRSMSVDLESASAAEKGNTKVLPSSTADALDLRSASPPSASHHARVADRDRSSKANTTALSGRVRECPEDRLRSWAKARFYQFQAFLACPACQSLKGPWTCFEYSKGAARVNGKARVRVKANGQATTNERAGVRLESSPSSASSSSTATAQLAFQHHCPTGPSQTYSTRGFVHRVLFPILKEWYLLRSEDSFRSEVWNECLEWQHWMAKKQCVFDLPSAKEASPARPRKRIRLSEDVGGGLVSKGPDQSGSRRRPAARGSGTGALVDAEGRSHPRSAYNMSSKVFMDAFLSHLRSSAAVLTKTAGTPLLSRNLEAGSKGDKSAVDENHRVARRLREVDDLRRVRELEERDARTARASRSLVVSFPIALDYPVPAEALLAMTVIVSVWRLPASTSLLNASMRSRKAYIHLVKNQQVAGCVHLSMRPSKALLAVPRLPSALVINVDQGAFETLRKGSSRLRTRRHGHTANGVPSNGTAVAFSASEVTSRAVMTEGDASGKEDVLLKVEWRLSGTQAGRPFVPQTVPWLQVPRKSSPAGTTRYRPHHGSHPSPTVTAVFPLVLSDRFAIRSPFPSATTNDAHDPDVTTYSARAFLVDPSLDAELSAEEGMASEHEMEASAAERGHELGWDMELGLEWRMHTEAKVAPPPPSSAASVAPSLHGQKFHQRQGGSLHSGRDGAYTAFLFSSLPLLSLQALSFPDDFEAALARGDVRWHVVPFRGRTKSNSVGSGTGADRRRPGELMTAGEEADQIECPICPSASQLRRRLEVGDGTNALERHFEQVHEGLRCKVLANCGIPMDAQGRVDLTASHPSFLGATHLVIITPTTSPTQVQSHAAQNGSSGVLSVPRQAGDRATSPTSVFPPTKSGKAFPNGSHASAEPPSNSTASNGQRLRPTPTEKPLPVYDKPRANGTEESQMDKVQRKIVVKLPVPPSSSIPAEASKADKGKGKARSAGGSANVVSGPDATSSDQRSRKRWTGRFDTGDLSQPSPSDARGGVLAHLGGPMDANTPYPDDPRMLVDDSKPSSPEADANVNRSAPSSTASGSRQAASPNASAAGDWGFQKFDVFDRLADSEERDIEERLGADVDGEAATRTSASPAAPSAWPANLNDFRSTRRRGKTPQSLPEVVKFDRQPGLARTESEPTPLSTSRSLVAVSSSPSSVRVTPSREDSTTLDLLGDRLKSPKRIRRRVQAKSANLNVRSLTFAPLTNGDIVEFPLGEEGADEARAWEVGRAHRMLDEITDVMPEEGFVMKLWNKHLAFERPLGDVHIPDSCLRFVKNNATEIHQKASRQMLALLLLNLAQYDVLSETDFYIALALYDETVSQAL